MYVIEIICGFKVVPNLWILIHLFTIRQQKISFFLFFFFSLFSFGCSCIFFEACQCYRQGCDFGTNLCSWVCIHCVFGSNAG